MHSSRTQSNHTRSSFPAEERQLQNNVVATYKYTPSIISRYCNIALSIKLLPKMPKVMYFQLRFVYA